MKQILVPTDFSSVAENAAEYAANLSKILKAKVVLLHVYHVPVPTANGVPTLMVTVDELHKRNEEHLKTTAMELKKKTGVEFECIARMGLAVDEILDQENDSGLIVMGMKSASRISEALMGSLTTATLRKAKIPVLVIPENVTYKTPEKIVFACDYDPRTDVSTLDALEKFIQPFESEIFVVNIKNKKQFVPDEKNGESDSIYYFPEHEDLVEGINEFVESKKADMVAIIPHKYNFIEGLFHKSISKKMAFHTHVPLLSLPDRQKEVSSFEF